MLAYGEKPFEQVFSKAFCFSPLSFSNPHKNTLTAGVGLADMTGPCGARWHSGYGKMQGLPRVVLASVHTKATAARCLAATMHRPSTLAALLFAPDNGFRHPERSNSLQEE
jgi:hypothetical protein